MRWLTHRLATLAGWSFTGSLPDEPKMVVIGAPHTSNWDFLLFLAALHHHRVFARFLAKEGLFRGPFAMLFRSLGGIPVGRRHPGGVVGQVVAAFDREERMILVIAPEGTRAATPHWRSGFLEIARRADVPVVLAGIDAAHRRVVIGPSLRVGADLSEFMDQVRRFYGAMKGLRPELASPVRLEEETS